MKKLILFDLDGTLTESKVSIDSEMAVLLKQLLEFKKVAVVSGCDMSRFETQLLGHLNLNDGLAKGFYLFPALGTAFYRFNGGWEQVYRESLPEGSLKVVTDALVRASNGFDIPWGKAHGEIMEERGGQITFSALGQEAPLEEKERWDSDYKKRFRIRRLLWPLLPSFEITVGGTTSISFTRKGVDKAYCLVAIQRYIGFSKGDIMFVGNAIFEGGDDYPLMKAGVYCVGVRSPDETRRAVKRILARCITEAMG